MYYIPSTDKLFGHAVTAIAVIYGLWQWRVADKPVRIFIVFVCLSFAFNMASLVSIWTIANTKPVTHLWTMVEFAVCMWFLSEIVASKKEAQIFRVSIALFAVFWIAANFTFETIAVHDTTTALVALVSIGLAASVTSQTLAIASDKTVYDYPQYWFVLSMIFYYALAASYIITLNFVTREVVMQLSPIHSILIIARFLLIIRGFSCLKTSNS